MIYEDRRQVHIKFTGRTRLLQEFCSNLTQSPAKRKQFWFISGASGIGKTMLLRMFGVRARGMQYVTAWVDDMNQGTLPPISTMATIARDLRHGGKRLPTFESRLRRMTDGEANDTWSFLGRRGGLIVAELLRQIPWVGAVAVGMMGGDDGMARQSEGFFHQLATGSAALPEPGVLMAPLEEISRDFVTDLNSLDTKVVLFFDAFEKTRELEDWLHALLEGRYGTLASHILVVIAGAELLRWHSPYILPLRRAVELRPFAMGDALTYLEERGVTDRHAVDTILKLSGRVPVLMAALCDHLPDEPDRVGDPVGDAVARFLEWMPDDERDAILTCVLPRTLNHEVIEVLVGDAEADAVYNLVTGQPFVVQRGEQGGWQYHESVRNLLLKYYREADACHFTNEHRRLATYFESRRHEAGSPRSRDWRHAHIEWLYHATCAGRPWSAAIIHVLYEGLLPGAGLALGTAIARAGADCNDVALETDGGLVIEGLSGWDAADPVRAGDLFERMAYDREQLDKTTVAQFYVSRSMLRLVAGDTVAACSDLNRALRVMPNVERALIIRGTLRTLAMEYEHALVDFGAVIDLQPDDARAYLARGALHILRDAPDDALPDLDLAWELAPELPAVYYWRGRMWLALDYPVRALDELTHAILLQDHDGPLYVLRAEARVKLGDLDGAAEDLDYALAVSAPNGNVYMAKAAVQHARGLYESTVHICDEAAVLMPDDPGVYVQRGCAYEKLGNYVRASADFRRALEIDPDHPGAVYWAGVLGC